ncbi:MAG: ACT domain-containing protein [Elusimicrobia bacterium]|nr:ACT domain-containing protein [Elusimicrobiota bacterium]
MTKKTVAQISIPVQDRPGTLRQVLRTLSNESINLLAVSAEGNGDVCFVRLITDQEEKALQVLDKAGLPFFVKRVFLAELPDKPGALHRLTDQLAKEGVNILQIYGTSHNEGQCRIVLSFQDDDEANAQKALERYSSKS